jgi:hypothetical protein
MNRNLFGVTSRRPAVNDFDLQPRQTRRRAYCVVIDLLVEQSIFSIWIASAVR